jgi:hypothetical protein
MPVTKALQDQATLELARQRHEAQLLKQFPMLSRMSLRLMDASDGLLSLNRLLNSFFAEQRLPVRFEVYKWYRKDEVCVFLPKQSHRPPEASLFAPLHVTVLVARQIEPQRIACMCKDCSWSTSLPCPMSVWDMLFKNESLSE